MLTVVDYMSVALLEMEKSLINHFLEELMSGW